MATSPGRDQFCRRGSAVVEPERTVKRIIRLNRLTSRRSGWRGSPGKLRQIHAEQALEEPFGLLLRPGGRTECFPQPHSHNNGRAGVGLSAKYGEVTFDRLVQLIERRTISQDYSAKASASAAGAVRRATVPINSAGANGLLRCGRPQNKGGNASRP